MFQKTGFQKTALRRYSHFCLIAATSYFAGAWFGFAPREKILNLAFFYSVAAADGMISLGKMLQLAPRPPSRPLLCS